MKLCLRCNTEKNITSFSKEKKKKDGRTTFCRVCQSEMRKEGKSIDTINDMNLLPSNEVMDLIRSRLEKGLGIKRILQIRYEKYPAISVEKFLALKIVKGWHPLKQGWFSARELISIRGISD